MSARDRPDGVEHREHPEPEGDGDAERAHLRSCECCRSDTGKDQEEGAKRFGSSRSCDGRHARVLSGVLPPVSLPYAYASFTRRDSHFATKVGDQPSRVECDSTSTPHIQLNTSCTFIASLPVNRLLGPFLDALNRGRY